MIILFICIIIVTIFVVFYLIKLLRKHNNVNYKIIDGKLYYEIYKDIWFPIYEYKHDFMQDDFNTGAFFINALVQISNNNAIDKYIKNHNFIKDILLDQQNIMEQYNTELYKNK